ncbi:helix-turn-helix domain-containing protein [Kribbella sp. NBC_01245]|uniref:helix-turn-helix domain-containing protein n=1 Tax=Kribbella sp. NBC_01245 TaxID=2903578 RepID=UPI002E2C66BD|nr:helix-turn-helix domain-containing protein [Kribbella sp. NBC_01245]
MQIHTTHDLGATARGRRQRLKLSQTSVGKRAGVSRQWLADFEAGKPTVEVGRVLSVLEALGLVLDLASPDTGSAPSPKPDTGPVVDLDALIEEYDRGQP